MFNKINKSDKYGQTHREIVARCPVNSRKKQFKVKNRYELISKSWGSSPVLYPLPCENCEIIRWFLVYFLDRTGDGDPRAEPEGLGDGSTNSWCSQKPRGLGWCFGTIRGTWRNVAIPARVPLPHPLLCTLPALCLNPDSPALCLVYILLAHGDMTLGEGHDIRSNSLISFYSQTQIMND